jgi:hypothetical protein
LTGKKWLFDEQRTVGLQSASELLGERLVNTAVEVTVYISKMNSSSL